MLTPSALLPLDAPVSPPVFESCVVEALGEGAREVPEGGRSEDPAAAAVRGTWTERNRRPHQESSS